MVLLVPITRSPTGWCLASWAPMKHPIWKGSGVTQDTDGWGGGAYLGLSLTDNLVLSATLLGTELDTDVNGAATLIPPAFKPAAA